MLGERKAQRFRRTLSDVKMEAVIDTKGERLLERKAKILIKT